MTVLCRENGSSSCETPFRDVLQRWRICLASLLFFTALITDGFVFSLKLHSRPRIFRELYTNSTNHVATSPRDQCLHRSRDLTKDICTRPNLPLDRRKQELRNNVHFKFCYVHSASIYSFINSPSKNCRVDGTLSQCEDCLSQLEELDRQAQENYAMFEDLMERYDCNDTFSVVSNCQMCKEAYKNWLCAITIPYYLADTEVLPCKDICQRVEETCPFFRPQMMETHAGDPSFICKDPQINGNIHAVYGREPACYKMCHVDPCQAQTSEHCPDIDLSGNATATNSATKKHPKLTICSLAQYGFLWWLTRTLLLNLSSGLT